MAVVSVENLAETMNYSRLDAEFYQPQYLIDFSIGNWQSISNFLDLSQYGISQAMTDEPLGTPIFRMDDIKNCFLVNDDVKYIETSEKVFKQFKLEIDDILFNRVNSEELVGRTGIFKLEGDYVFASYLIRVRIKPNSGILPDYLNIFLNSKYGKKQIRRFTRRAVNQANVNAEELKKFKIALINLDIQKNVSDLSNNAWEKLSISKSFFSKAEKLLLKEFDFKESELKDKNFYSSDLFETFKVKRIDAEYFQTDYEYVLDCIKNYSEGFVPLLDCVSNVKPNFNPKNEPDKLFSYVELSNIDRHIGVIEDTTKILGVQAPSRAKRILKENDVIVSTVEGSLEKVALVDKEFENSLASTGFFQFRTSKIPAEVLLVLSKSILLQKQFKRECSGTILTAVPTESLNRIIIPKLQNNIQEKIIKLVRKSHEAKKESDNLLKRAISEVEKAIENNITKS